MDKTDFKVVDIYYELRNMIFRLGTNPFGDKIRGERTNVAVLMEFVRPKAVVTLVAIADGTASLYFSSGGGVIGAGESELVRMAASDFINVASRTSNIMEKASFFPLPQKGFVRFYVVSLDHILTTEVLEEALEDNANPLSKLFRKGHELISSVRLHDQKKPPI